MDLLAFTNKIHLYTFAYLLLIKNFSWILTPRYYSPRYYYKNCEMSNE